MIKFKRIVGFSFLVIPYLILAAVGHDIYIDIMIGVYAIASLLLAIGE